MSTKEELRKKVLTLLRNQEGKKRLTKSLGILDQLFGRVDFREASSILFYASFDGEVVTHDMIIGALKLGKTVGLPVMEADDCHLSPRVIRDFERDLVAGPYGIRQPRKLPDNEMTHIDMVIVPGVVFDKNNHRIGRGAGYYDRFLGNLSDKTTTVGLAFDFQMVDKIPCIEPHDVPVDHVLRS
ncbi:MAG: 5-formyltetrahydrofolate cyclo-ligase [Candidatus Omnitrophica bacterium]|nr:5-formyltetrahydrofolate cyclo-ligase [Candidatus Omnitrophota bacterium]